VTTCLACGIGITEKMLDLGSQSNVNRLLEEPGLEIPKYPLAVKACANCGHGQLSHQVNPEELFVDYLYASSTSRTLKEYSKKFAAAINQAVDAPRVLEIASNDGIMLREFEELGVSALGVEPASRMVAYARSLGLRVIEDFWPTDKLGQEKFDIVFGQNVLAHTPSPLSFLSAVKDALEVDGLAIFQTSQADMLYNGEFDTVYHEHYSFFCENSASKLAERAGLELLGVIYTPIHGTSSVYVFGLQKESGQLSFQKLKTAFEGLGISEVTAPSERKSHLRKFRSLEAWSEFAKKARNRIHEVSEIVSTARGRGFQIVAVGAAAKGLTFLKAADIKVDFLLDEAEDKIDKWADGLNVQIKPLTLITELERPFFIFTAWNFASELENKIRNMRVFEDMGFLTYFPEVLTSIDTRPAE
jgi:SAM-dependent methyltransferase